jgi:hypothetical protein
MEDDPEIPEQPQEAARPKPSKTPSWVMVGFAIGALFVWLLPRPSAPPEVRPAPATPAPVVAETPPRLMVAEALFERWGDLASWDGDRTEVAAWNIETGRYDDYFEVRRIWLNDEGHYAYYFRTIPGLSRPIRARNTPDESLLQFTESEEESIRWRGQQLEQQVRQVLGGPPRPAAPPAQAPAANPGAPAQGNP